MSKFENKPCAMAKHKKNVIKKVCSAPDSEALEKINLHNEKIKKLKELENQEFFARVNEWHNRFICSGYYDKIQMLRDRTIGVKTDNYREYKQRRIKKARPDGLCAVCNKFAICKHHITPLIIGGSNNQYNLINICDKCHCMVHDFLIPITPDYIKEMDKKFRDSIK